MNKLSEQAKDTAKISMRVIYDLIRKFYACQVDTSGLKITIPFIAYDIVISVRGK